MSLWLFRLKRHTTASTVTRVLASRPAFPSPLCRSLHVEPTMNVTRHNFDESLLLVEQALNEDSCAFMTIDTEFTGLSVSDSTKELYIDTLKERYDKMREIGNNFMITQFGLSTFHCSKGNPSKWTVKIWNFYIFPRPYGNLDERFLCQASSLDFLSNHGFDFNKFISEGVSYIPNALEPKMREYLERDIENTRKYPPKDLVITAEVDKAFIEEIVDQIEEWLVKAKENSETEPLKIFSRNSFRRLLIHHTARTRFTNLYSDTVRGSEVEICLLASESDRKQRIEEKVFGKKRKFEDAVGFSKVIQLMSSSRKPVVGHNCLLDFIFLFRQFQATLPPTLDTFKEQLHALFPLIYDTKHIALASPMASEVESTSLGNMFDFITEKYKTNPTDLLEEGFDQYKLTEDSDEKDIGGKAHEAGYDAFMTGIVFLGLNCCAENKWAWPGEYTAGSSPSAGLDPFANRINIMFSDAKSLDIGTAGQVIDRSNVYCVCIKHLPTAEEGKRKKWIRSIKMNAFFPEDLVKRVSVVSKDKAFVHAKRALTDEEIQSVMDAANKRHGEEMKVSVGKYEEHIAAVQHQSEEKVQEEGGMFGNAMSRCSIM